jgi:hypothetical protein
MPLLTERLKKTMEWPDRYRVRIIGHSSAASSLAACQ